MSKKKLAFVHSLIALLLCASMLVGTTFAWFTDSVSSGNNRIVAGNLDIGLEYWDGTDWAEVVEDTNVFEENTLWEPGHTEVVYLKISNLGSLALKYQLGINIASETGSVNVADERFMLSDYIRFAAIEGVETPYTDRAAARAAVTRSDVLAAGYTKQAVMEPGAAARYVALVVYMPEEVDNAANYKTGYAAPEIKLGIDLFATQQIHENDSFGNDYDGSSWMPPVFDTWVATAPVTVTDGVVSESVTVGGAGNQFTAEVPAGVKMNESASELQLNISTLKQSEADVKLQAGEVGLSLNVHMNGVAEDNTVPMRIDLGKIAPIGLYDSNISLYHVEDGVTVQMTQVTDLTALDAHNEFYYNSETGEVYIMLASFSEVYASIATTNPWDGSVKTDWYSDADELTVANAAELAGFAQLVAKGNTFEGKTVKLSADINMGGSSVQKDDKLCFYPIGVDVSGDADTVSPFKGTFDGNGKTISNIYQNTWMLSGHYDAGYYNEAMGLFGLIDGGTVKNLVIDGMVAEGEFADIGCVTAYARGNCTFDNIRIANASCYSYNCRTAGIVGYDWIGESGSNFTFSNIEIDPTSTFGALWGSWDVACAGILGYKNDASKVAFTNCEVGCELDVYNDVCGNYQYYQYRYAGMMIGTVGKDSDPTDQVTNGNITFSNCTVHYGDWVDYYYCEFEKNSMASYSEDYQFSRVPASELKYDGNGNVTGCTHTHTDAEDKRAVHIPFGQLFTGYGWGATAVVDGVNIEETKYTITYINDSKVLDVTYVTDNSDAVSTTNAAVAEIATKQMAAIDSTKAYKFSHWMNAGSTRMDSVEENNDENIVLYPAFEGVYTATFVDLDGNVLAWDTYTKNSYSNVKAKSVTAPDVVDCIFDYWEVRVSKDGTVTNTKLSEYAFGDEMDITIYPVYTYDGDVNLIPVDNNGDGITDEYQVGGYSNPDGQDLVEIPESVNGIQITTVNANAFSSYEGVHAIVLPATLTFAGSNTTATDWGLFDSGEEVTIYYAGSYEEWVAKEVKFEKNWDNGISDTSRIFFLNGTGKVDTSQGYLKAKVSGYFTGKTVSWEKATITESIMGIYTSTCNCKDCNGAARPDNTYWEGVTIE